jgi:hypothetical protein
MRVCQFRHFGTLKIQHKRLDWQLDLVLQRRGFVSNSGGHPQPKVNDSAGSGIPL